MKLASEIIAIKPTSAFLKLSLWSYQNLNEEDSKQILTTDDSMLIFPSLLIEPLVSSFIS